MASAQSLNKPKATQAELARKYGVSRQSINELVTRGVLVMDEKKLIDVELAEIAIRERLHPSSKTAEAINTTPAQMPTPSETANPIDLDSDGATSYHIAKTLRETEEAKMAKMKRQEMERELIRVDAVRKVIAQTLATIRESLGQIPARLHTVLAAENNPNTVHRILTTEVDQCLEVFSNIDRLGQDA